MRYKILAVLLSVIIILLGSFTVTARPPYLETFNEQYYTEDTKLDACLTCHNNANGGGPRNPYGMAYEENGRDFASIENLDSDGDGFTNLEEINNLTFPGDPADKHQTASEAPSETGDNENDPAEDRDMEDASAPANESEPQETTGEPSGDSASEQQSPGFGAVLAIAGITSAIYLKRER
ncbi:PGF-CTERM sorting domain-containing protein [Methanolobus halotolerans]|uniref:PGF-CTERM protein n=1 Tax=Methanolobus halotolerans TaxID=2052935 RepID=A0A4E0Q9Y3_9EURY|nr:PGF-CTERM sorting domain-containing protein [Methanolobus halotolerans]TGC09112.1 hypothetical protein CUN85_07000 [Methanolobus halotolerans]